MADTKRRGRPKGSGIDDARRLRDIARLLAAEPELKPTTAIRTLGYSNPSVIRRLRDKLNVELDMLLVEARRDLGLVTARPAEPDKHQHKSAQPAPPAAATDAPRQSLLQLARDQRRTAEPCNASSSAPAPKQCGESLVTAASAEAADPLPVMTAPPVQSPAKASNAARNEATLVEIGFQAAAVAMRQHLQLCQQVVHIPAVAAFIRQQMFLTEMMLGVGLPSQRPDSTRH